MTEPDEADERYARASLQCSFENARLAEYNCVFGRSAAMGSAGKAHLIAEMQERLSDRRVIPPPPRRPRPGHAWMTDEPHHYAPVPRSGPGVFGPVCLLAVALSGVALVLLIWGVMGWN